ncbi:MAG: rhodanese-like domain-containing protein [Planctomycetota bacterium]
MRTCLISLAAFGFAVSASAADPEGYAKPEMLIGGSGLSQLLRGDTPLVVIDVRSRSAYDEWHVPSARWVDVGAWTAAFGEAGAYGKNAAAWSERIGALGIDADTTVVVYDRFFSPGAARVWWLLRYWGVDDVRLLDGGPFAYQRVAMRVPESRAAGRPPADFVAKPQTYRLATRAGVLSRIAADSRSTGCLIDTRSDREFAGGAIPTASHSDWRAYVDAETGRLKPPAELRRLLRAAGVVGAAPAAERGGGSAADAQPAVVTYCRTGGRASVVAFVAELVTGEPAANYWGSWNDWTRQQP